MTTHTGHAFGPLVDIHSHVLPGLDDGARDTGEALAMLRVAAQDAIDVICATPHDSRCSPAEVVEGVERLNALAASEGVPVKVVPGSEVRIAADICDRHRNNELVTLNGTAYILLELWLLGEWPRYLKTAIYDLQVAGLRPILAHAERYPAVQRDPRILLDLVSAGVVIQVNASSLVESKGSNIRETAETLVHHRIAHVIASDAHRPNGRSPALRAACERAAMLTDSKHVRGMCETASTILSGAPVTLPDPIVPAQRSRIERMWHQLSGA